MTRTYAFLRYSGSRYFLRGAIALGSEEKTKAVAVLAEWPLILTNCRARYW